jgi:hypothetical protein
MESKKINQLATEMAPVASDLTIIGDPITGVSKKITLEQLAVLFGGAISFYSSYASFPATGDVDIIYCAKDTNKLYLWNGAYVEIFPSQALLDTYQLRSEKGNANGYASLDSLGKVPVSQLPSSLMEYKGTWNASTNTPTLANGTGDTGDVYICSVAGTVNFGAGAITFAVGDYVIYSGTIWQRSSGATGTVTSVAVSESSAALTITGSPITTSGTINIGFAGTSAQYVAGDGSLVTFPSIITEAQKLVTEVYNSTGATLTKGTVVYINGGQGNLPTITKAIATGDSTSAQTYGVVQSDITNMNNGYVVAMGALINLDTQAYSVGTQLYLSSTTAGAWTSTKQYAPNHLVYVGIVVRSHPTQGVVEIRIQNGFELDELHDVSAQTPSNNHGIFYNSSTSLWENKSIATVLGYTPISLTSLSASSPLSYNNTTGAFSISQASGSADGYLSSTDWTTFNSKQDALTNPITGTGASGRIAYFNGTTTQTSSANLTWDATNNRVGIGLTNPQRSLEIYNATADSHLRLSGAAPSVSMGEAITGAVYQAKFGLITSNGQFVTGGLAGDFVIISQTGATIWATSGGEKMRLTSGGNLGIGTTSPTFTLQVSGTTRISGQLSLGSTITNATYTYTLPGATGTLALTSDLGSYLPLSGGTLTGQVNFMGYFSIYSDSSNMGALGFNRNASTGAIYNSSYGAYQLQNVNGDFLLSAFNSAGTYQANRLTISSTGAATFSQKVQVTGSTSPSSGSGLELFYDGSYAGILGYNRTSPAYLPVAIDGSTVTLFTNSSPRLTVTNGGNVGIGTSAPRIALEAIGTDAASSSSATPNGAIMVSNPAAANSQVMTMGVANGSGNHSWIQSRNSTTANFYALALNPVGGNVGIGTTSPQTLLSVETSGTQSTVSPIITSQSSGTTYTGLYSIRDGAGDQRGLIFQVYTANVGLNEKMRISSAGNVGIGTTSPAYKLDVTGQARFTSSGISNVSFGVVANAASGIAEGPYINLVNVDNSYQILQQLNGSYNLDFWSYRGGWSNVSRIDGSSGTYTALSDKNKKKDFEDSTIGLQAILGLKPTLYRMKSDSNETPKQLGFIAQEVEEFIPQAYVEQDGFIGLNDRPIIAALVKAIQELKSEIDELKNK